MQVKLTKMSFIMTLSKVRFIQILVNVEVDHSVNTDFLTEYYKCNLHKPTYFLDNVTVEHS
jgi:hypothetical protein